MSRQRLAYSFVLSLFFAAVAFQEAKPAEPVDFQRHIQPILATRCMKCHGGSDAEGGLRLTQREAALVELDSGAHAIVPGDPEQSELLRRVLSKDDSERMPPEGPALTKVEIERLTAWIKAGAPWPEHWAYRPLVRPRVPSIGAFAPSNAATSIDHFIIHAQLAERKLTPSSPADKRTLLRRVYFDLIGLPPTPAQLDAFLADNAPNAYERVVDELLASPRYGERWSRHWMDIVHYAETHGHDQDRPRDHAWPYRDYLIDAFNRDKPYSRFVEEQVAGDVLYPGDPQALVATGFLATGPWDESSLRDIRDDTLDREIARYIDRDDIITTVMTTFVSSTVHCARCHDHKFDPISQREYYSLQAVFAGTDKGTRKYDADPHVAAKRLELSQQLAKLEIQAKSQDAALLGEPWATAVAIWEDSLKNASETWIVLDPAEFTSAGGATLTELDDHSVYSAGERPDKDTVTVVAPSTIETITGLRLEVLTDERLPHQGPGRQDNGNLHLNELRLFVVSQDAAKPPRPLRLVHPKADFNQEGWTIERALDGNPASAWGIYPQVGQPHYVVFAIAEPLKLAPGESLKIELQQTHGGGHLIGRLRLLVTGSPQPLPFAADPMPAAISEILRVERDKRTDAQRLALVEHVWREKWQREFAGLPEPARVYCGSGNFEPDNSFRPAAKPREIRLLARGEITKPGEVISPGTISVLPPLEARFDLPAEATEGERRAALAKWLSRKNNALTWRSMANRLWHYHFGRGLVDTPSDFGQMGSAPSHPELLDWLAVELRETDSLKHLHRLIVTSAVYQQSSEHREDAAQVDVDNRYLWRMHRSRLDAEAVRDATLEIAGELDLQMGGPSVKQFIQTPGTHVTPNVDYVNFHVDAAENRRRSVYRFVFRTIPDPFMDALDCPDASQLTAQRNVSVTALQALTTLNDKVMVRQCEHLAARLAGEYPADVSTQVKQLYRRVLLRAPTDGELTAVASYAQQHGLANACRVLLNSNEFMFVD